MKEYFKDIPRIAYEGKNSDNPLAFKFYNPDELVGDKTMKDHLKFSIAFWHTFTGGGVDPLVLLQCKDPGILLQILWKRQRPELRLHLSF